MADMERTLQNPRAKKRPVSDDTKPFISRTITGRPRLRVTNMTDRIIFFLSILFIATTIYTVFFRVEYKWEYFSGQTLIEMMTYFFRIDLVDGAKRMEMILSLVNTLALGFVTTIAGCSVGLILGLFAARNLTNGYMTNIIRAFASLTRAVPTLIWVLIFVAGYGLTSTTAVVGMFFHTLAFFIKSFAEAFEEVEKDTIDALKATGSNWLQIVFGAVLPSSMTKMISWIAIRNEINFGVAVVIGPAAGVPGTIGSAINNASRAGLFAVQGFGVLLIFLTAFLMELGINYFRQRSIVD